jgi:GDPmannose 4,6-dehydratase
MRALICGVSGQDGSYLAQLLLSKGYEVIGTSRDATTSSFSNLDKLNIRKDIVTTSMATNDFRSVLGTINKYRPDEIYNLSGQTSVGLSFEQPVESIESIMGGTLNFLEAIRFADIPVKFYSAGSSECFGDTGDEMANELTIFEPRSPYAVAKASAYWLVKNYRESYGIFASTGILFNHESVLRPTRFVTQKIVYAAARIFNGSKEKLHLGNIAIWRDWGLSADYVDAMWRMLQCPQPEDFVIATGVTVSLEKFVELAFSFYGLNWREHVEIDSTLLRPSDITVSRADPSKAKRVLDWSASHRVEDVVRKMCESLRELH